MNLREKARAAGGDELVAQLDEGSKVQALMIAKVKTMVAEAMDGIEVGSTEEKMALVNICEALSVAFSSATALCTVKAFDNNRSEGIICAMKSVSSNINDAFDEIDMAKTDVLGKIIRAASKGK